jgi:small basic protein (TIGR04137 family)
MVFEPYSPNPLFINKAPPLLVMSQHSSLRNSGSVGSKRSVLTRGERIKLLKARGLWTEGRLPTNLPKTKPE